jgi:patatin-related protein
VPEARPFTCETRLAVVMYGGVSLAIYINGVAQELLSLVRATAPAPDPNDPSPTLIPDGDLTEVEKVYREIGRRMASEAPYSEALGPTPARIVVDVISGTSAGGLNGIFLAKALANGGRMTSLKDLWVEEGDLNTLLNDRRSREGVPLVDSPPEFATSLLNSQRMLSKLLRALRGIGGNQNAAEPVLVDELDLFVTATDLHGLTLPLRIANGVIQENRYKNSFHFVGATARATGARRNDFDAKNDSFIAFAGRCTSSFPVAFEPMQLSDLELLRDGMPSDRPRAEVLESWRAFFSDYIRDPADAQRCPECQIEDFVQRPFGDGGYLDNKPFSRAIDALQWRRAGRNVERKLVYVEPSPEHPEEHQAHGRPDPFSNLMAAASTLPRQESIREDLERVLDRNRQIEHVLRATRSLAHEELKLRLPDAPARMKAGTAYADEWLADGIQTNGIAYGPYYRLKVAELTSELADIVASVADFDEKSDDLLAVRMLMSAWRQENYDSQAPDPVSVRSREARGLPGRWKSENHMLLDFDLSYRLRRLAFLGDIVEELGTLAASDPSGRAAAAAEASGSPAENRAPEIFGGAGLGAHVEACRRELGAYRDELTIVSGTLARMFPRLREAGQRLRSRDAKNPLFAAIGALHVSREERHWILRPARSGERLRRARMVLGFDPTVVPASPVPPTAGRSRGVALSNAADAAAAVLGQAFQEVSRDLELTVPGAKHPADPLPEDAAERVRAVVRRCIRHYHDVFEAYDMAQFPMVYGSNVGELATVDIVRISPEDATGLARERDDPTAPLKMSKLAGTRLFDFGAFLDADWRRSDILWGRLDTIEILLEQLLPPAEPGNAGQFEFRRRLILRAQAAALGEDLVPLRPEGGRRVLVEAFLHTRNERPDIAALNQMLTNLQPVLEPGSALAILLDRDGVQAAYAEAFEKHRELDAKRAHRLMARAATIFGRVIEGVSGGQKGAVRTTGRMLASAGRVAWGFVEVAIPDSLPRVLSRKWLQLIYLLEGLLIVGGIFVPGAGAALALGEQLLAGTLLVHTVSALLTIQYRGDRAIWRKAAIVLVAAVIVLAIIGAWMAPEFLHRALAWLAHARDAFVLKLKGWTS